MTEVSIAMAVIGFGVLSLLHAMAAGSRVNAYTRDITQATFLAQEIREWTVRVPFSDPDPHDMSNPPGSDGTSPQTLVDDLDDAMSVTYSPPRTPDLTDLVPIDGMEGWAQIISMEWRNPDNLTQAVSPGASDVVCVTVVIQHDGVEILRSSWLVYRREQL